MRQEAMSGTSASCEAWSLPSARSPSACLGESVSFIEKDLHGSRQYGHRLASEFRVLQADFWGTRDFVIRLQRSRSVYVALDFGSCCCTEAHFACSCETSDSILSANR